MIDIEDAIIVIPKVITDEMKLCITRYIDGVLKLDSSSIDIVVKVKRVLITLNAFPNIYVI